jgi:ribosomal protein S18 acetylase RimI-like enzyme
MMRALRVSPRALPLRRNLKRSKTMKIRPTQQHDLSALQLVLDGTALFPGDLLPAMISGFLTGAESSQIWLTCDVDGTATGFCYAIPEMAAEGTWNMLAIAVLPALQGGGHGRALMAHLEETLRSRGQRILIVDTSGTDAFSRTREFYRKNGYTEEARIREFWATGDDKITFWKSLV